MTYDEAQAEAIERWGSGVRAVKVPGDKSKQCRIVFLMSGRRKDVVPLGVAANWKAAFRRAERFMAEKEELLKALLITTKQEREEMKLELQSGDAGRTSGEGPGGEVPSVGTGGGEVQPGSVGDVEERWKEAGADGLD